MAGKSIHANHRERMMDKFMQNGMDSFSDHEVLEILLYYAIPRIDTNETAHRLCKQFGSFHKVMEAKPEELCKVKGIGARSAQLICFTFALFRRYQLDLAKAQNNVTKLNTVERMGVYFTPQFAGETDEVVLAAYLDNAGRVLRCEEIMRGNASSVVLDVKKIVRTAVMLNAAGVAVAHNHPNGDVVPSPADFSATNQMERILHEVGVKLTDHIVVAGEQYASIFKLRRPGIRKGRI